MAGQTKKRSKTKPKKRSRFKRALKIFAWTSLALFSVLLIIAGIIGQQRLIEAEAKIPDLPAIMQEVNSTPSVIVSSDGEELYKAQEQYRKFVNFEDIPQVVIDATVAAEDKRFFDHDGVDYKAMAGVGYHYLRNRDLSRGGGSTLTMQIAKNAYTSSVKTIDRKLDDMALAIMIERTLTKEQILELYLNQMYYGERSYGISAAADTYFGKELKDITLTEAATLARLVRLPSIENPIRNKEKALRNRNLVLRLMLEEGKIEQSEYDAAIKEELVVVDVKPQTISGAKRAPYFVDSVIRQLEKEFPNIDLKAGGYRIETTLNWELQEEAEKIIQESLEKLKSQKVNTAAIIVLDSEGRIIAHIGGGDYNRNQYDVVWQGARQPGSSFKPFVYATAFNNNIITPYDLISNAPYKWEKSWGKEVFVKNSNGIYGGFYSPEWALKKSINVPAARVIEMTGPANVVNLAKSAFGFRSRLEAVPALALGATAVSPLEMARAYSVFKTGGDRLEPWQIVRIIGPDGHTIKRYSPKTRRGALSKTTAKTMDTILYSGAHSGTAFRVTSQEGVVNARGKTGTTNNFRDAWLCGYTDKFVAVGWVGSEVREDGAWIYQSMSRVFGGTSVAPFWGKIVKKAQEIYGEKQIRFKRYFALAEVNEILPEDVPEFDDLPILNPNTIPPINDGGVVTNPPTRSDPPVNRGTEQIVYRLVCGDTMARATVYCPVRTNMPFKLSDAPEDDCPMHGPPD